MGTELKALGEDLHFWTKNGHFVVQFLDLLCLGTPLMVILFLSSSIFFYAKLKQLYFKICIPLTWVAECFNGATDDRYRHFKEVFERIM